jgi:hypothetical protein
MFVCSSFSKITHIPTYRKTLVVSSYEVGLPVLKADTRTVMVCPSFFHNSHTSRHIEERLSACYEAKTPVLRAAIKPALIDCPSSSATPVIPTFQKTFLPRSHEFELAVPKIHLKRFMSVCLSLSPSTKFSH